MAAMNVGSGRAHGAQNTAQGSRLQPGKLSKDHEKEKKKKKHHFFSSSKS
jgi:syntaxin-binding protein 1